MLAVLCLFFLPADTAPKDDGLPQPASLSITPIEQPDEADATDLGHVRRIYVDVFTGGESAAQLREQIIGALERSKLFTITEKPDRADAVLKGAAKEEAYTDSFHSSDNADARTQSGTSQGEGYGKYFQEHSSKNTGSGLGDSDSTDITEHRHEARAAVRLVTSNGDVIWSTTQESLGAKFQSASEDVAERVAKQLAADYRREHVSTPPH
jgi:hypothetical protein